MVSLKDIRSSNRTLQTLPPGLVAVFAGATAGIGLGTLRAFAKHTNGPRAYIIGRSKEKAHHIIDELKVINPIGTFVFIGGQFSLIKEVDRICEEIKKFEQHVDIVFMSTGYLSLTGRHDTQEGIETDVALQYYSRLRLVTNLIPLLERSYSPRVVSCLLAGFENTFDLKAIDDHTHYSLLKHITAAGTMTTIIFEELANKHPTVSFIHSYPGSVGTNILPQMLASTPGVFWYPAQVFRYTTLPLYRHLICMTPGEAGERQLFMATSCKYPPAHDHESGGKVDGLVERPDGCVAARPTVMTDGKGNGVYRVSSNGEVYKDNKVLDKYRKEGMGKTVYEHTVGVWEKALRTPEIDVTGSKESAPEGPEEDSLDFEVDI